jgi:hypothetical protein
MSATTRARILSTTLTEATLTERGAGGAAALEAGAAELGRGAGAAAVAGGLPPAEALDANCEGAAVGAWGGGTGAAGEGSLMVGEAVGLGGRLIRTVSFLG